MAFDVKKYSKTVVAIVGAVASAGAAYQLGAADGIITTNEAITIVIAAATAAGVYFVPNKQEGS